MLTCRLKMSLTCMSWVLAGKHSLLRHPDLRRSFVRGCSDSHCPMHLAEGRPHSHGENPELLLISAGAAFVPGHFSSGRNWVQGVHPGLHRQDGYVNKDTGNTNARPAEVCVPDTTSCCRCCPLKCNCRHPFLLPGFIHGCVSLLNMCVYLCEKQTSCRPVIALRRTYISPSAGAVVPGVRRECLPHHPCTCLPAQVLERHNQHSKIGRKCLKGFKMDLLQSSSRFLLSC